MIAAMHLRRDGFTVEVVIDGDFWTLCSPDFPETSYMRIPVTR